MVGRDVDETLLMEKVPATGGKPARWLIRQGQYITVGELFETIEAAKAKWGDDDAKAPDISDAVAGLTQQMAHSFLLLDWNSGG